MGGILKKKTTIIQSLRKGLEPDHTFFFRFKVFNNQYVIDECCGFKATTGSRSIVQSTIIPEYSRTPLVDSPGYGFVEVC